MDKMNILKKELVLLIKAKYPILQIESFEEDRIISLLKDVAKETGREIYCWSITKGLIGKDKDSNGYQNDPLAVLGYIGGDNSNQKAIYILKDFHKYIEDPIITRSLRDLCSSLKEATKTIILTTPCGVIPRELEKSVTILDLPYPGKEEFSMILNTAVEDLKNRAEMDKKLDEIVPFLSIQAESSADKIVEAGLGLTYDEYENVIYKCISNHSFDLNIITGEKKQIIRKSGVLEYYEPSDGLGDIGGLDALKDWVRKAGKRYSPEAEAFGLEKPRGILLIGPPGTGKSLMAKAIAQTLMQALLRLDMAGLSSKYYGETGNNVKQALKLADAVAPVVLWFDEIEKMFSTGQNGEGHEETMRSMGTILTHFEESISSVFRVATSNSPFNIKPELMQRFEKVFFVDLPLDEEREEIFAIHLRKVGRDPKKFNLSELARASPGFVGREIRTIVKEALANAFDEGCELTDEHLLSEIRGITPMSKQKEKELNTMREWAEANAISASRVVSVKTGSRMAEV